MNIYIEVENFYKEFPGKFLLALNIVSKNCNIYIAHRSDIQLAALKGLISPGVIHLKDVNSLDENYNIIKKLHSKGFIFTAQDEEPGITIDDYDKFSTRRMIDGKTFEFIEFYFSWGKRDLNILKKKYAKYKTQFILAGSLKIKFLDNYKINEKQIIEFKSKLGIKKKIILIPTSIASPIAIRRFADWLHSFKEGKNLNDKLKSEKRFFNTFKQATQNLEKFIELIRFLESNMEDFEIILKSHPDEKIDDWKKLIDIKSEKIHYVDNISVQELIMFSDVIIQNGSSVVLDAFFSKKPIITYEPLVFKEDTNKTFPNSFGKKFSSKEDLKKYLKNGNFEILADEKNMLILRERLHILENTDYPLSYFIKAWKKIREEKFSNSKNYFQINHLNIFIRELKRRIKKYINFFIKLADDNNITNHKFPNINMNYVKELHKNLSLYNSKLEEIKISKLDDRILEIKIN